MTVSTALMRYTYVDKLLGIAIKKTLGYIDFVEVTLFVKLSLRQGFPLYHIQVLFILLKSSTTLYFNN